MRILSLFATESALIEGCLAGKPAAQKQLYQKYNRILFAICLRYADRKETAEDILQETFVKIFQKLSTYNGQGSFEGWLKKIAVRTALDYYRQSLRQIPTHELIEEIDAPSETDIEAFYDAEYLTRCIQSLPAGCRAVFNLYAIEGYNHQEIAEMLNIGESSSRSQLAYARKKLSALLNTNLSDAKRY